MKYSTFGDTVPMDNLCYQDLEEILDPRISVNYTK